MDRALPFPSLPRWSVAHVAELLLSSPLLALCPAMLVPVIVLLA